jgi:hypothetical protein
VTRTPGGLLARYLERYGGPTPAELEAQRRRDRAEAERRLRLAVAEDRAHGLHDGPGPVPLGSVMTEVLGEIGRRVEAARRAEGVRP